MPEEAQSGQEPAKGETPTTEAKEGEKPQAEPKGETKTFDEAYVKELRAEAAKNRKAAQEATARAQEYEDAQKSELEKANTKAQRAEQAKAEAEARLVRYQVAQEKEVPAKLVPLLTATSKEDLEAQADLLIENAKESAPKPDFDAGVRDPAEEPKTPEQAHRDFLMNVFGKPIGQ